MTMIRLQPALTCCALLLASTLSQANDFPTVDRVLYVQECVRNNPGPHYEMINKCSCALDRLASEVKFDDYVSMSTIVNATSIGGERYAGSFMQHSIHRMMYYDASERTFAIIYVVFFVAVLASFWVVKPRWPKRAAG